jgi:hypothetical protein
VGRGCEFGEGDTCDAAAVRLERGEVAKGLGAVELGEAVGLPGYRQLRLRFVHDLDEDAAVRAALVELAGGVEVAGAEADRCGHAEAVAEGDARGLERGGVRGVAIEVGRDGDVVAGDDRREDVVEAADLELRAAAAGEDAGGGVLGLLDVRLVERVDVEDVAGDGRGEFPAEELEYSRRTTGWPESASSSSWPFAPMPANRRSLP